MQLSAAAQVSGLLEGHRRQVVAQATSQTLEDRTETGCATEQQASSNEVTFSCATRLAVSSTQPNTRSKKLNTARDDSPRHRHLPMAIEAWCSSWCGLCSCDLHKKKRVLLPLSTCSPYPVVCPLLSHPSTPSAPSSPPVGLCTGAWCTFVARGRSMGRRALA